MTVAFFFAWANSTDTTWNSGFEREDEKVFSAEITATEGDFPSLKLVIKNPYVGLLNTGRKVWGWLAYNDNGTAVPLFFGRLVGLPNNLFAETLELHFMARAENFLIYKQTLAEQLKTGPYYDDVFVDAAKRDDPDSVLEAYSVVWHWDRLPTGSPPDLHVTTSDIIHAEDGNEVFTESDVFYDSVRLTVGQQPLTRVRLKAQVHWTQQASGRVDFGSKAITCWNGGSLIGDWPKPGAVLDGGYSVAAASAVGSGAQYGQVTPRDYVWQNHEQTHEDGDAMSTNITWTVYPCGGEIHRHNVNTQSGFLDPDSGMNIPLHVSYSETMVCEWIVNTYLALDYEALRPRTETLEFTLTSDLQPILTAPDAPASLDTEVVTLSGGDVGSPIQTVYNWYSLTPAAGWSGTVPVGTYVKSTVNFIGPPVYAICVQAGSVGGTEPNWPDTLGSVVVDGSVHWAIQGTTLPTDYQQWKSVENSEIALGTVIKAMNYFSPALDLAGIPIPMPPSSIQSYQICVQAGKTQFYSTPQGTGIADLNPQHPEPNFSPTTGVNTADGTVIWQSLGDGGGTINIPLGNDLGRRSYFPTARGQQSIGYCLGVARAHLLHRARCVQVEFECRFERVIGMTLRKSVLLEDHRMPGGQVLGKVTTYTITLDGDKGLLLGRMTIAAAVGTGNAITVSAGTPSYVDVGYVDDYQYYSDQVVAVSNIDNDVGYTVPLDAPDDDGIVFPVTNKNQLVVREQFITGKPPGAAQYLPNSVYTYVVKLTLPTGSYGGVQTTTTVRQVPIPNGYSAVEIPVDTKVSAALGGIYLPVNQIFWYPLTQYYLEIKPLQGINFAEQFNIDTTLLMVDKMIDLAA